MRSIFCFLFLLSTLVQAQEKKLHQLEMGHLAVGFKTITVYDLSRPAVYISDIFGKLGKPQNEKGRQIKINLWYPAGKTALPMKWNDYIAELGQPASTKQEAFSQGLSIYLESINDLRGNELPAKEIKKLYGLNTYAYKNAVHQKGKFPVVLFPSYRSPSTITILSEYLASHGFIVASIGLIGTESEIPEISAQGIQTMALDLLFATNYLRNQSFVDENNLAAMGVGINATAAFALKAATPEVDALISLEGGILSVSEMQFLRRSTFYDPVKFSGPELFIYAPHPSIQPKNVEELKYADKYFIYFPKMSEYYFLDYGILDQYIPGIIGTPPGDTRKGFELGAKYILNFLNFSLKNSTSAKQELMSAQIDTGYSSLGVIKNYVRALPVIPSLVQMKNLLATNGISAFIETYDKAKKAGDTQPFTQQYLTDLYNWLAFKRDIDFSKRKIVAETRVELYPRSSRAHFALATVYFQLNNKERAIDHYNEVLKLLTVDNDTELTVAVKERIQSVSSENLKKMQ